MAGMTKKLLDTTGIAALMQSLGTSAAEVKAASDVLADMEITKATTSQSLTPGEHVTDRWDQGQMHRVPTSEELKIGPVQHSSGGGAEKMIGDYSRPAPQDGTTTVAEQIGRELGSIRGYAKSIADAVLLVTKSQETTSQVLTALIAAQAEPETAGIPGEAESFSAWHTRKAQQSLAAMKAVMKKARSLADNLDELEGDARKAAKAQVKDLRGKAARLGRDALAFSYAAKSADADPAVEVRASLHGLFENDAMLKADVSSFHDKDKDKDEEKKAKKAMRGAAKKAMRKIAAKAAKKSAEAGKSATAPAASAAAATTAATKATETGDDAAKAAAALAAAEAGGVKGVSAEQASMIEDVLKGNTALQGSVREVMELIRGRPLTTGATTPVELMKSSGGPEPLMALDRRIDEAVENDQLSPAGEMKARDMLQKITAVRTGGLSEDIWNQMLNQSPLEVQQVFRVAA